MNTFERDGISFRYPLDWRAETEEDADGGWSVTVSSPDTAFFLASLQPEASDAGDLADQALDSLKEVYSELDFENVTETICGLPAVGSNADFLTADTAVICRVRGIDTFAGPLLLLAQVSEFDRERNDPVLRAIVKSLDVDTDR
ncbi:hypothetical protein [Frigoriglobus tundricola]|uniref:Uncharacterized protein n=1 Tax=Frigoriglobus tundricola TaxID=2774151 RepID=A0A6M5YKA5_9BACT|nr:hypothetical protein [Frigoriglobus tundricola]QJW93716.1 hypothetical protein FTUN_1227 [Frigoriglobus tundricola]